MKQRNWQFFIPPQCGVVAYAESAPGQAKTACIRALAQASNRRFVACYLDQMLPEDIGGVPSPRSIDVGGQQVDGVVKLLDEALLRAKLEPSVVLMDELNQASHSMMAAAQEWLNNPPSCSWVFACGNPIAQASNGVEFTPPFVNRLCVVKWERPVEARREGWKNGFKDYPAPSVPIVPADYLDVHGPYWGELLCQFEDRYPELFGDAGYPKDESQTSQPWPSDRSWTNVGKLLCAADAVGANPTVRHHLVEGCVGVAAAAQWTKWLAEQKLPDPEDFIAEPHTLKLAARFDWNRAVIGSILGRLKAETTKERWERGYDIVETVFDQQPELALSAESALWTIKKAIDPYTPRVRPNGAAAEIRKLRLATV
jgi:hypothetical protein